MEFDDQEEQEHEVELRPSYNHDSPLLNNSNSTRLTPTKIPMPIPLEPTEPLSPIRKLNRYKECQKNHAVSIGTHAVDGCGEFMASGPEGTLESLKCASCSCHRNFHRKETDPPARGFGFHNQQRHPHQPLLLTHHPHGGGHFGFRSPTGYLHVAPPRPTAPLTLPSSSGGGGGGSGNENEDYYSNPSSSGGKKRFRTRFTVEQKDKMLSFAERLGWRIQKHDEEAVQGFCNEIGVRRHVLKVWMHNNKHTLGKKID